MEKVAKTTGMMLGKFMPPHLGHLYLADFGRNYVDELTILMCSIKAEPIPGELRYEWMRELCPKDNVIHVTAEVPQEPSEHPDFWSIWHDTIRKVLPTGPDYVFASEDYGLKLAEILGAEYVPVDPGRSKVPISGSAIRENPMATWEYIPPCVRPYYAKRVCIFGPESTGKSTLAEHLADHYETVHVPEYARGLLDPKDGKCDREDIPLIANGQMASEDAMARQANRLLICDTDLITTTIWSDVLFGDCPQWIKDQATERRYDLYLLMDIDVPWVDDNQRYLPNEREQFLERCENELRIHDRLYVKINGSWDERFKQAREAIERHVLPST